MKIGQESSRTKLESITEFPSSTRYLFCDHGKHNYVQMDRLTRFVPKILWCSDELFVSKKQNGIHFAPNSYMHFRDIQFHAHPLIRWHCWRFCIRPIANQYNKRYLDWYIACRNLDQNLCIDFDSFLGMKGRWVAFIPCYSCSMKHDTWYSDWTTPTSIDIRTDIFCFSPALECFANDE